MLEMAGKRSRKNNNERKQRRTDGGEEGNKGDNATTQQRNLRICNGLDGEIPTEDAARSRRESEGCA